MNPASEHNVPLDNKAILAKSNGKLVARSRRFNVRGFGKVSFREVLENSRVFRAEISSIIFLPRPVAQQGHFLISAMFFFGLVGFPRLLPGFGPRLFLRAHFS